MYNEVLLSPLRLLHNEYSECRLLHLYTAEAVQVVTKEASKNRSSAFFLQPRMAGSYSLQVLLLDILSGDRFS